MQGYTSIRFKPDVIHELLWSDKSGEAKIETFVIISFYFTLYLINILDGKIFAAPVLFSCNGARNLDLLQFYWTRAMRNTIQGSQEVSEQFFEAFAKVLTEYEINVRIEAAIGSW